MISRMLLLLLMAACPAPGAAEPLYPVGPIKDSWYADYDLSKEFYRKGCMVEGILIATSARVSGLAVREAAYQFDHLMKRIEPDVAKRIRERNVLCLLVGHDELTSDLPQFKTDKTGKELDFYNWRKRGFLTYVKKRPIVLFSEEDVLEYEGGMQLESILIHEFAHVIHKVGFDRAQHQQLKAAFEAARAKKIWNDGRAAQRFRRVRGDRPVLLLDALAGAFPRESRELLAKGLDGGDIQVNGKTAGAQVEVTEKDQVLIVFGGEKQCYAGKNASEYFAEGVQCWYDTNRTMDHDHNHIITREQLVAYDPGLAELCRQILGDDPWRFISPRKRAGRGHLAEFDPGASPKVVQSEHIRNAALDYYDRYWKPYWPRLYRKYGLERPPQAAPAKS